VSLGAILGLLGLNAWLLLVGVAVMFGVRGWASWMELVRLLGVAYMLGVACSGVFWVAQLVIGIDLSMTTILASGVLLAALGVAAGVRLGRRLPPRGALRLHPGLGSIFAAISAGLTIVYLQGLFRAGRLGGLYEFDAWSFWVPKAQAIYYFGGLDSQFFRELPNQSYPPLLPALEAAAFHFMGGADVVTLHLQFWFLLAGFVAAVIGLLSRRVPPLVLWPPIILVLVTPHVVGYALQPQADFLLDELFALGVLLVGIWLLEREEWMLVCAALLLAAAMLTKREGYMFAACLVVAAFVAVARTPTARWKLLVAALVAALATVPWRAFLLIRDLSGGGPEAGGTGLFSNLDRAWPSLRLALSTLFDFHLWLLVAPLLALAILLAFVGGTAVLGRFAAVLSVLCIAGFTWSTWAFPSLPITKEAALNPIVRLSGGLVVSAAALVPLLLAAGVRTETVRR
jgi:hypothetical protein